jgi:hypothetical protein
MIAYTGQPLAVPREPESVSLATIVREWGRIGCIGFGGPPTHIKLLRDLCVERRGWLQAREFEDAIAVCNLLAGPASTQLAIFCAWRLRGRLGALAGGAAFIIPGLIVILALAALLLAKSPPPWGLGAGAGAGGAVPARGHPRRGRPDRRELAGAPVARVPDRRDRRGGHDRPLAGRWSCWPAVSSSRTAQLTSAEAMGEVIAAVSGRQLMSAAWAG